MKAGLVVAIVLGVAAPAEAQDMPLVSIPDIIVDEGDNARFDIVVTGTFLGNVEVSWQTEALSATSRDFPSRQGTITLTPDVQPYPIEIPLDADHLLEGSEALRVRLTGATNATIAEDFGYAVIRDGTPGRPRCDLDADGHSDILIQYVVPTVPDVPTTHVLGHDKWSPQSTIIQDISPLPTSNWGIEAAGDFDGNGTCDFLWSWHGAPLSEPCPNSPLRADEILITEADRIPEDCQFLLRVTRPGAGWQVVGSDDTDADGVSDVLWWNPATRSLGLWLTLMEPVMTEVNGGGCMTESWSPAGLGRLSAGPLPDLLGYGANGGLVYWAMHWTNGAFHCQAGGDLRIPAGGSLAAVGDFDADGFDDLLWEGVGHSLDADGQLMAYFVRARDVTASSPMRWDNADVSGRPQDRRHFAGPR